MGESEDMANRIIELEAELAEEREEIGSFVIQTGRFAAEMQMKLDARDAWIAETCRLWEAAAPAIYCDCDDPYCEKYNRAYDVFEDHMASRTAPREESGDA